MSEDIVGEQWYCAERKPANRYILSPVFIDHLKAQKQPHAAQEEGEHPLWCARHQNDLVVKQAAEYVAIGQPYKAHEHQCPKETNQWTHLGRLLTVQVSYQLEPKEFCESHIHAQVGMVTDMLDVAIVNQGESNDQE
ncbi:hypothetical protein H257_03237 [Aphanomyces astaci]|uniref:Uncharacterized protein n=1 Tax=Aphanomyces astaci TaxID=112090 RepID=W4H0I2_APHAT|nr:hypothetical protein H257_03237 [Aphanomyces astaci]ETV85515.1 hypothetical protein H257_03237 [Aphanomyces astaci]|eukprot:XP_009825533.1 hypothetical protein H257_03237 [Aphanomyces astaci]